MDNFAAHKVPGVREAIEKAGATLRYLPKYSPDLNPIELPYSKFKDHLRKTAERTSGSLPNNSRLRPAARGSRMCQLLQACRLCFNMSGNRF
jgi:transposase